MKKLILTAAVAMTAMFIVGAPVSAHAGETECAAAPKKKCCLLTLLFTKKKCCTVEVCRRCFCKTICVCGCPKKINYIEVTYCTTYCDGSTKNWTKTYRA